MLHANNSLKKKKSIFAGAEPPWGLGGLGPPNPQRSPQKKKKKKKKLKLKFYSKFYYFSNFDPSKLFFSIWPPNLGAGSAPAYLCNLIGVFF
jgi:hypothetical protein